MRIEGLLAASVLILAASPAHAVPAYRFDVPAGRLGDVIAAIGRQAGVSIGISDAALAARRSPGVQGRMSLGAALARALAGTGGRAVYIDATTISIVAAGPERPAAGQSRGNAAPAPPLPDIIITASKQGLARSGYPGSVEVLELGGSRLSQSAADGSEAVVAAIPVLTSTSLGPGRDKLFIRGIADSSFNGPSQSTAAQYFGDARLTYSAPGPDLALYDLTRIEVLVGPQGNLYGSGALGGIIKYIPAPPEQGVVRGSGSVGVSSIRSGGTGIDAAGMINVPIGNRVAARLVAYSLVNPGYIDDPSRGLKDVNRAIKSGVRLAIDAQAGGWALGLSGIFQNSLSRDSQYTLAGDPPLVRNTALAQPFDNDFRLLSLSAHRRLGALLLNTATSLVRHDLTTIFDATGTDGTTVPRTFEEDNRITLLTHETRVSGGDAAAPWVVGINGLYDINRLRRGFRQGQAQQASPGVRNENVELAVFGQYAHPLTRDLIVTLGGRGTFYQSAGSLLDGVADSFEPKRTGFHVSPSVAILWKATAPLQVFLHYQEGYRAGGLAISASGSTTAAQRFKPDELQLGEFGVRHGDERTDRLSASATLSYAHWQDIQADLIDTRGLPFTANIGNGHIVEFDVKAHWRITDTLSADLSGFLNQSRLSSPSTDQLAGDQRALPNVAENGARGAVQWRRRLIHGAIATLDASLRYVGRSQLGVGPPLDVTQGGYAVAAIGGRIERGPFALSIDVSNLADTRANRFAFGNPFGVANRDQLTPLQPRTVRVGISARF